jgi:hypothetical protein
MILNNSTTSIQLEHSIGNCFNRKTTMKNLEYFFIRILADSANGFNTTNMLLVTK